jgi:hypothetical protein
MIFHEIRRGLLEAEEPPEADLEMVTPIFQSTTFLVGY